jgi:hypothetical protein
VPETNPAGKAVYRNGFRANQFRQCTAYKAKSGLDLEGAVLPLTESQTVPGIVIVLRFNIWDAVLIAPDHHRPGDAGNPQSTTGNRKTATQQQSEE